MSNVTAIRPTTSHLFSISIHRNADGSIGCALLPDMSPRLIETTGVEVYDRMEIMAGWLDAAMVDFRRQAQSFKPE